MSTIFHIEHCLLPAPEFVHWNQGKPTIEIYSTMQKVVYYTKNLFTLIGLLIISPFTLIYDFARNPLKHQITQQNITKPKPAITTWPPKQRGFATSLFQTCGLGTKWSVIQLSGRCDWDKWMDNSRHITHTNNFQYDDFFTDVLTDPTTYINMLKTQQVTAHRFSLEWSVIEPKKDQYDEQAIALYNNFIQKLLDANITPSITLNHFVVPEWFYNAGNFQKGENIDHYVTFALKAMELFPQVTDWWSFNELGVKAFQQTREAFPMDLPEGSSLISRVHAAGIATQNMLIAHCKLHQAVTQKYPANKIGVTHQWLKFDTATGNWLERAVAYYLNKFSFDPVYTFFQKGRYSFEFPFMANIHFDIPSSDFENSHHFLMRLGVQAYPQPMIKMGLNHGQTYPGVPNDIKNGPLFSFGSTCEPNGTVMRFGPRWKAERMDDVLDDAFALTDQVYITEYGADAKVFQWGRVGFELNDKAQADYLQRLTERIRDYSLRTFREIKGIFCWSDLRQQLEWENGCECQLGLINGQRNDRRQLIGWQATPASDYLKRVYQSQ